MKPDPKEVPSGMKLFVKDNGMYYRCFVEVDRHRVYECGWHGGDFQYQGEWYMVLGPYHGLDKESFRVYKLTPVTEAVRVEVAV